MASLHGNLSPSRPEGQLQGAHTYSGLFIIYGLPPHAASVSGPVHTASHNYLCCPIPHRHFNQVQPWLCVMCNSCLLLGGSCVSCPYWLVLPTRDLCAAAPRLLSMCAAPLCSLLTCSSCNVLLPAVSLHSLSPHRLATGQSPLLPISVYLCTGLLLLEGRASAFHAK